ncbi:MAG: hypothetical protein ABI598_07515 [Chloroflexota bacterium]
MITGLGDVLVFVGVAVVIGLLGAGFGIFFVAPRLSRLADRNDEEPGARDV